MSSYALSSPIPLSFGEGRGEALLLPCFRSLTSFFPLLIAYCLLATTYFLLLTFSFLLFTFYFFLFFLCHSDPDLSGEESPPYYSLCLFPAPSPLERAGVRLLIFTNYHKTFIIINFVSVNSIIYTRK